MTHQNIELVHVYYHRDINKIPLGRLAYKDRKIYFEYDENL